MVVMAQSKTSSVQNTSIITCPEGRTPSRVRPDGPDRIRYPPNYTVNPQPLDIPAITASTIVEGCQRRASPAQQTRAPPARVQSARVQPALSQPARSPLSRVQLASNRLDWSRRGPPGSLPLRRFLTSSSPSTTRRPTSNRAYGSCTLTSTTIFPTPFGSPSLTTPAPTARWPGPSGSRPNWPRYALCTFPRRAAAERSGRRGPGPMRRCWPTWMSTCPPTSAPSCRWWRR